MYVIYTDGSALDNNRKTGGGPGGIGYVVLFNGLEHQYSLGFFKTTNNRMEMMAIIHVLEEIQTPSEVEIRTDSQYTIDCVTKYYFGWVKRGWITSLGAPVQNQDLIKRIRGLMAYHDVKFTKVKGHSGDYYNELCDKLAKEGSANPTEVDVGFISSLK